MREEDWVYCQEALVRHSRTFALPIASLPGELRRTITCAYLLCRIADTVEDTAAWAPRAKEELQRLLLDILDDGHGPEAFQAAVQRLPGGDANERDLLLNLERVLGCFLSCPAPLVASSRAWIGELVRGMCIYSRRRPGADGVVCLESEADLERYCYFVAGTIGRLLTECFLAEADVQAASAVALLRAHAERFAAGLQLVNILRDITADLERQHCFVPRTLLAREGLSVSDLVRPECRQRALAAIEPLFLLAEGHLEAALEYTLALPQAARAVRSFCAIPLWMAARTLELCRNDPKLLLRDQRVKLSRPEVLQLVTHCTSIAGDNAALRESFRALPRRAPLLAAPTM